MKFCEGCLEKELYLTLATNNSRSFELFGKLPI
jgi:hypothetical protein